MFSGLNYSQLEKESKMHKIINFYRKNGAQKEYCFNIEVSSSLDNDELRILKWLLADYIGLEAVRDSSFLEGREIVELGPRLNFETPFSSNAVSIFRNIGLSKITRLEVSRRYVTQVNRKEFIAENHDRMTECEYPFSLKTFETGIEPEPVKTIPLIKEGGIALERANLKMGLGLDKADRDFVFKLFVESFNRDPTDVELFGWANAFSEHSRHGYFKGKQVIDGVEMPETLMEIVESTLKANPANSVLAFCDNSSAIIGYDVRMLIPKNPGDCSAFVFSKRKYHLIFTAETHNFPSGVAPFPGAETGTGGRIRDIQATGRGGLVIAGTAGYCVAALNIPGYYIPGEPKEKWEYPSNLASPFKILIRASDGASDYGNKFGEPVINGFCRSFDMRLPDGERRAWLKPIMFTGGIGQLDGKHLKKCKPKKGMLIIQIGGPAYRVGVGGGSASSMVQGENEEELDLNAVQRGNAEMENKYNRVVRACIEMGEQNPIECIHDQGAGGPCNVLTEIVELAGGRIELRKINVGDKTMSVKEIWVAEYQERVALLIKPERIREFQLICEREKVECEVLGNITEDGKIVVYDEQDGTTPFNLDIAKSMEGVPQKVFSSKRIFQKRAPLNIPANVKISKFVEDVFKLPSVGSKKFLTNKVDRSVTGLIAQQQCCGPLQLPVSDCAVVAQSHFGETGAVISIGEQPIKILVDVRAGARMAIGEALLNMAGAVIPSINHIKCSLNWMWASKLLGEGALLYDAGLAMREAMIELGIAVDGGKDSLSMAAKTALEMVKAPGQMAVSLYAPMSDIGKKLTPDIKYAGKSTLWLIDFAKEKRRLGGSAFAQSLKQIGDQCPDIEDVSLLRRGFNAIQEMVSCGYFSAIHDISDGGLITALAEMIMPSMCGAEINLNNSFREIEDLFAEELGVIVEVPYAKMTQAIVYFYKNNIPFLPLGHTCEQPELRIESGKGEIFCEKTTTLLQWWERTSDELEKFQMNIDVAKEQSQSHIYRSRPVYNLTFSPCKTPRYVMEGTFRPEVAIIREEGSNSDREMASAFRMAGFEPWDVSMTDLLEEKVNLEEFYGVAFVGGFSYADVLGSARGWAGSILFNEKLRRVFDEFYNRPDTFSLGVCNGCQLMALLGWVPFKGDFSQHFVKNKSERFESRWSRVVIRSSPAIMLKGMEGSVLGIHVAHGEGQLYFSNLYARLRTIAQGLAPMAFVDDSGELTEKYPDNPNGSPLGITALCSPDGRHLAMMPHPERTFLKWQWHYWPPEFQKCESSPWLRIFQNAYNWCIKQV